MITEIVDNIDTNGSSGDSEAGRLIFLQKLCYDHQGQVIGIFDLSNLKKFQKLQL